MKTVKVNTKTLLEKVRKNRDEHRKVFEKAYTGFRVAVIKQLDEMTVAAKAGRRFPLHFSLIEPIDQTREYDRAIEMLDMSVDEVTELSQSEFAQLVMDDWSWKKQFTDSTAAYLNG